MLQRQFRSLNKVAILPWRQSLLGKGGSGLRDGWRPTGPVRILYRYKEGPKSRVRKTDSLVPLV